MRRNGRSLVVLSLLPLLLAGCGGDAAGPDSAAGLTIEAMDAGPRSGAPFETLADSVAVRVIDAMGAPLVNMQVSWSADRGGSVPAGFSFTDADGIVQTRWKLGPRQGTQTLRAHVGLVASVAAATAEVEGWRVRFVSSSSGHHSCAVDLEGKAWCWGENGSGQLGDGTQTSHAEPTAVASDMVFTSISTGAFHTCALALTRQVFCWGSNSDGALGDGTLTDRLEPTAIAAPAGASFASVVVNYLVSCAATDAGAAYCWGWNRQGGARPGQGVLGTGSTAEYLPNPTPVGSGLTWRNISIFNDRGCGITTSRELYCWGSAADLGMGAPGVYLPTPTRVTFAPPLDTIAFSLFHQCGLFYGTATCWGAEAAPITLAHRVLTMSAGFKPWFGLGADGRGYYWGGIPNSTEWFGPVQRPFEGGLTLSAVGGNDLRPCAIEAETSVLFCWSGPGFSGAPSDPVAFRPPA
jgi:Regulator of chromosome condensation (RCC1) repeat